LNKGRHIVVREAADGEARFTFGELCSQPLGAGDYLKIVKAFHILIIGDVPVLEASRRNEAKRLIRLVDTLYDNRTRLIMSAEAEPDRLWLGTEGVETQEFKRTASRLIEMRSDAYWEMTSSSSAQTKKARAR
jgi:cell division protein ZapE